MKMIFSNQLQSDDSTDNYWRNAVPVHYEKAWYCFSSTYNPHAPKSSSLRLKDQKGIANLWHTLKLLTHSKQSGYNEIKNQRDQSVKGRGLTLESLWLTGVNDKIQKCSYYCAKFLIDLVNGQAGIPGHEEGNGVYQLRGFRLKDLLDMFLSCVANASRSVKGTQRPILILMFGHGIDKFYSITIGSVKRYKTCLRLTQEKFKETHQTFGTKKYLNAHKIRHSFAKPFKCHLCPSASFRFSKEIPT